MALRSVSRKSGYHFSGSEARQPNDSMRPYGGDDLLWRVVAIVGRDHVEAAVAKDRLAFLDVRAFEPDHQRHLKADFLHRRHHTLGDDIAAHDAAEDVDQDAFDVGVGGDDLERRSDFLL